MVRDEPDRTDDDRATPLGAEPLEGAQQIGAQPLLVGAAGALPDDTPGHRCRVEVGRLRHQLGRPLDLVGIGVAGEPDRFGQRVCAEQDRRDPLGSGVCLGRRGQHPAGQQFGEAGCVEPLVDPHERQFRTGRPEGLGGSVEVLTGPARGAVRGEHDADHRRHAPVGQVGSGVLDRRLGVFGAVGDHVTAWFGGLEQRGQPVHLGPGALGERRDAPDGLVAPDQVGQLFGRGWPAPADPRVEGLDLLGRPRGAMGHHQDPDRRVHGRTPARPSAWTSSTTAPRMPGSVSGRTPWPRLKM